VRHSQAGRVERSAQGNIQDNAIRVNIGLGGDRLAFDCLWRSVQRCSHNAGRAETLAVLWLGEAEIKVAHLDAAVIVELGKQRRELTVSSTLVLYQKRKRNRGTVNQKVAGLEVCPREVYKADARKTVDKRSCQLRPEKTIGQAGKDSCWPPL